MAQVNFVTPVGTAVYPWLTKPDYQYDDAGKYQTKLSVPADDKTTKTLIKQIEEHAKEEFGIKAKPKLPFEQDAETGNIVLKLTSKFKPTFFDAKGSGVTDPPNIWGGSQIRIKGNMSTYSGSAKGVSLYINAVQIITAVQGEGSDDSFDAVDMENAFVQDSFEDSAEENLDGADF